MEIVVYPFPPSWFAKNQMELSSEHASRVHARCCMLIQKSLSLGRAVIAVGAGVGTRREGVLAPPWGGENVARPTIPPHPTPGRCKHPLPYWKIHLLSLTRRLRAALAGVFPTHGVLVLKTWYNLCI